MSLSDKRVLTEAEKEIIKKKPLSELNIDEMPIRLQLMNEELEKLRMVPDEVPGSGLEGLGPTDKVRITVPIHPDGRMKFNINGREYYGNEVVEKQTAEQLLSMISEAYRHDRELLISRGNLDQKHGTMIRGEQMAKIEKFQAIMSGGA